MTHRTFCGVLAFVVSFFASATMGLAQSARTLGDAAVTPDYAVR